MRPNAATPFASFTSVGRYATFFPRIPAFNKTFLHVTASGTDNGFCKPDIILNDGATPAGTEIERHLF